MKIITKISILLILLACLYFCFIKDYKSALHYLAIYVFVKELIGMEKQKTK